MFRATHRSSSGAQNCNCSLWFLHAFVVAGNCWKPQTYVKPEAAITVFELLMMSGVSLETCWAIKKHSNDKVYYTVSSCWLFLYDLYYDARFHEHLVSDNVRGKHEPNVFSFCDYMLPTALIEQFTYFYNYSRNEYAAISSFPLP